MRHADIGPVVRHLEYLVVAWSALVFTLFCEAFRQSSLKMLDAKYEKAILPEIIKNNCSHLNSEEQAKLLEVLNEFEDLFDGTLGDWDTEPVSF